LSGKGRVGDGVGEGTGATEVHNVAEGHPCSDGEENAAKENDQLVWGYLADQK
jgi:hypothetical protein